MSWGAGRDLAAVESREDFADALRELRQASGSTVRAIADRADVRLATVGGWFSGKHVPTPTNQEAFRRVLGACGVTADDADAWWAAVLRVRRATQRRAAATPYRGLAPFSVADSPWFHGREDETDALLDRVRRLTGGGVLAVVGASGAGKSSLLSAGLLARIERGDIGARTAVRTTPSRLRDLLDLDPRPDVVVVDQAEELWGEAFDASERRRYLDRLEGLTTEGTRPVVAVVALRADFYASALTEPTTAAALSSNPLVVGPLDEQRVRRVITAPAETAGARVDPALIDVLLAELGVRSQHGLSPSALPLLSHVLLATWERARTSVLSVEDYRRTGGIAAAVEQTAEAVLGDYDADERAVAERLLLRLVDVDGPTVTRRLVPLAEVGAVASEVVDDFTDARLVTVDEQFVSITHESLVTTWPRFAELIEAHRDWVVHHRALTRYAHGWNETGRDRGELLSETRSALYESLLSTGGRRDHLNVLETEYLTESAAELRRTADASRRRARVRAALTSALAVMTILAVAAATLAVSARSRAVSERNDAVEARAVADARVVLAQSQRLRDQDPALSAQLAVAAYEMDPSFDARSAVLDTTASAVPTRIVGPAGPTQSVLDDAGRVLAVGYSSGSVDLYSVDPDDARAFAQAPPSRVTTDAGPVQSLAVDASGTRVAIGSATVVAVYDITVRGGPRRVATLPVDTTAQSIVFRPGTAELAVGTATSTVLRWSYETSAPPTRLDLSRAGNTVVDYTPDGRRLVGAGNGRALAVWDTVTGDALFAVPFDGSTYRYLDLDVAPDGTTLAAGTTGREVRRWTIGGDGTLTDLAPLGGFGSYVTTVAFDLTGQFFAAGSADASTVVWQARTDDEVTTLPGPANVGSVAFGGTGSLITSDGGGTTRRWRVPGPDLPGPTASVFTLVHRQGGPSVLAGVGQRGDGAVMWPAGTGGVEPTPTTLRPGPGVVYTGASALSWDSSTAAVGTSTGGVETWDVTDPARPARLGAIDGVVPLLVGGLAFTADDRYLLLSQQDAPDIAVLDLIDPAAPRAVSTFTVTGLPSLSVFRKDRAVVHVATSAATVESWDLTDPVRPVRIGQLTGLPAGANAVTLSADDSVLAVGTADGTVTLVEAADPARMRVLGSTAADTEVYSLAFDADDGRLVGGTSIDSAWIWDVRDPTEPRPYAALSATGERVYDAVFVGVDAVVAGGVGGRVRQWTIDPESAVEDLCARAGTPVTEPEWAALLPGVDYAPPCDREGPRSPR
ncbi:helix-turn-helix domain-containing protein [Rhodococcoides corynebacterioides]|uniref:nSTAND1 domain-containing NTPase n=1 Tax=Rhodococcoides corynebacterioides TaxID=53972 RepID=UPI003AE2781D